MKSILKWTVAAVVLSMGQANAEEPENYIKYRQAVMSAIGGHVGAATQIVRGKVSPPGALAMHADALAKLSADLLVLFPEGSDFGETKAKEKIWSEWDKFKQVAEESTKANAAFAQAVAGGDKAKIGEAFKAVGEGCKGCHKEYRLKDED